MARRIPVTLTARETLRRAYTQIATDVDGLTHSIWLRSKSVAPFNDIRPAYLRGDKVRGQALLEGHFDYAGQRLDIGAQGDPWTIPAPSERFARWLHSFEWLEDLVAVNDGAAFVRARFLVDRWIAIYGKWNAFVWDGDLLSRRLYIWLKLWSPALQADSLSNLAEQRRRCVMRQLKYLRHTYKRVPAGLPRLRAAVVFGMAGARMQENADIFLLQGLDDLDDQIDQQILPDGGHISRNPETTLAALRYLFTLDGLLQERGAEGSSTLRRSIDRLLPIIAFFQAGDGGLCCFNGGGEGAKTDIQKIFKTTKLTSRPFGYSPHTGYQRIEKNGTVVIMDSGSAPSYPHDDEAHLAPLAIEISNPAGRLIVNCGWNAAQPAHWRRPVRATAAHSTLVIDNQSAGRVLKPGFRSHVLGEVVSAAAETVKASRKEHAPGVWLETSHDGYVPNFGLLHRRRVYVNMDGNDIRGEDILALPLGMSPIRQDEVDFDIRFHLHPDVKVTIAQNLQSALLIQPGNIGWRFRTDGGPLAIEPSIYLGQGNRPVKSEQLVISGRAYCDSDGETRSNRVRWSLRQLEGRRR